MANYRDPNPYADYGAAMASKKNDPMAVEWQNANDAKIAAATTREALAAHVANEAAAKALLAKVKGAYTGDPLDLTVIGAVSQYVMETGIGTKDGCDKICKKGGICRRKIWNKALIAAIAETKDAYLQTFYLDQLRWSPCRGRVAEIRALDKCAASEDIKKYIAWVADEVDGNPGIK